MVDFKIKNPANFPQTTQQAKKMNETTDMGRKSRTSNKSNMVSTIEFNTTAPINSQQNSTQQFQINKNYSKRFADTDAAQKLLQSQQQKKSIRGSTELQLHEESIDKLQLNNAHIKMQHGTRYDSMCMN